MTTWCNFVSCLFTLCRIVYCALTKIYPVKYEHSLKHRTPKHNICIVNVCLWQIQEFVWDFKRTFLSKKKRIYEITFMKHYMVLFAILTTCLNAILSGFRFMYLTMCRRIKRKESFNPHLHRFSHIHKMTRFRIHSNFRTKIAWHTNTFLKNSCTNLVIQRN